MGLRKIIVLSNVWYKGAQKDLRQYVGVRNYSEDRDGAKHIG